MIEFKPEKPIIDEIGRLYAKYPEAPHHFLFCEETYSSYVQIKRKEAETPPGSHYYNLEIHLMAFTFPISNIIRFTHTLGLNSQEDQIAVVPYTPQRMQQARELGTIIEEHEGHLEVQTDLHRVHVYNPSTF